MAPFWSQELCVDYAGGRFVGGEDRAFTFSFLMRQQEDFEVVQGGSLSVASFFFRPTTIGLRLRHTHDCGGGWWWFIHFRIQRMILGVCSSILDSLPNLSTPSFVQRRATLCCSFVRLFDFLGRISCCSALVCMYGIVWYLFLLLLFIIMMTPKTKHNNPHKSLTLP